MADLEEISIEEIKPEENVEEINLLDGESIKIELPSQDQIISGIDESQMILEGKGSKQFYNLTIGCIGWRYRRCI